MPLRPSRLRVTGRGWVYSDLTGRLCHADEMVRDVRLGTVHKDEADYTPGFGTWHPQDKRRIGYLDDPSQVKNASGDPNPDCIGLDDLGITDADVLDHIRTGKPISEYIKR